LNGFHLNTPCTIHDTANCNTASEVLFIYTASTPSGLHSDFTGKTLNERQYHDHMAEVDSFSVKITLKALTMINKSLLEITLE
jgi:hypothetical protein